MPWIPVIAAGITAAGGIAAASMANKGGSIQQAQSEMPWAFTPYSRKEFKSVPGGAGYSMVTIDPTIRNIRRQTLENLPGYRDTLTGAYGGLTSNLADIRSSLASNNNPYIQARVNPLLESGARQRGVLTQGLARRGIFGPLASQSMDSFENNLSRQAADQRALATSEQLSALLGVDTQTYNAALSNVQALQGLDSAQQSVAAQDLAQELSALGLTQADVGNILAAAGLSMQQQQLQQATIGRGLYALGAGLEGLGGYQPPPYHTGWDSNATGMDIGL